MIEIEKKFKINKKQLAKIEKLADFVSEKVNVDIYHDDKKYSLTSKDIWLRKRNNTYELKYPVRAEMRDRSVLAYDEIIGPSGIGKKLRLKNLSKNFTVTLKKNGLFPFCKIKTVRRKYEYGDFMIDVDEMDFRYSLCEVEKMVKNKKEIKAARGEIMNFAKSLGLDMKLVRGKIMEYLWRNNKKHYKELIKTGIF